MLFALSPEVLVQAVVNVFAVAGGFLLGQLLVGIGFWLFARRTPAGWKRAARLLGGTVLAVFLAVVLFGHGYGWTLFGGGGKGDSKGNGPAPDPGEGAGPAVVTPATPPAPAPPPKPADGPVVRVTVLGGSDVRDERFYQLDADPAARTFAELTAALDGKKAGGKAPQVEVVFPASNTLPRDHPAVTRLSGWAASHGVAVTFPAS